ncbi:MAG: hypothetical protein ABGX16_12020 [Pirellulales bacterium]
MTWNSFESLPDPRRTRKGFRLQETVAHIKAIGMAIRITEKSDGTTSVTSLLAVI